MEPSEIINQAGNAADKLTTSQSEYNEQSTERLRIDMQSDNILSKSIRPITLLWLMSLFTWSYIYTQVTGKPADVTLSNLLGSFLTTAIIFYFSSRAAEKIGKMITRTNGQLLKRQQKADKPGLFSRIFASKHAKNTPKNNK